MFPQEMERLGWSELDVLLISGDAYVDHPSFAMALLGRSLVAAGFRTGIIAQPPWADQAEALAAITRLGRPRLLVGIGSGAIDSMLAHYTAFRKKRSDDAYTPGGRAGARPNRAILVYTSLVRRAFPGLPVILGGIEASLRRLSHYDFWSDSLRRSILLDSKADLLACGMGEESLRLAAQAAAALPEQNAPGRTATPLSAFRQAARGIPGVALPLSQGEAEELAASSAPLLLPSHEQILAEPSQLIKATLLLERQVHQASRPALQWSGERCILLTPPAPPPDTAALDRLYALPFARLPHPSYREPIPAWEMIRASITSHRGCAGGCAFCSLALHQGRRISSRSRESILAEAAAIARGPHTPPEYSPSTPRISRAAPTPTREKKAPEAPPKPPAWAGSITDVGGPSANMWQAVCSLDPGRCNRPSCLHPSVCPGFQVDQAQNARLLRAIAALPGIRHVRVASGVRFDLALRDPDAMAAYTMEFTGGQLKVAPEHCVARILDLMRKPGPETLEIFLNAFARLSRKAGKEQYIIPYLMSAYPGCTDDDMQSLARWLRKHGMRPQQIQCFIPTPGTLATAMFFAGQDANGNPIHVARSDAQRLRQHHMLLPSRPTRLRAGPPQKKCLRRPGGGDRPRRR